MENYREIGDGVHVNTKQSTTKATLFVVLYIVYICENKFVFLISGFYAILNILELNCF